MSISTVDLSNQDYVKILQAYQSFWNMFQGSQGIKAEGSSDAIEAERNNGKVYVDTQDYLKISNLRYRRDRPADILDICFQPELVVRGREANGEVLYEIEQSTTRVSYLRRVGERISDGRIPAEIKQAMHYDFEADPDPGHPIFHVQYEPSSIDLNLFRQEYRIENAEEIVEESPDFPRIPSAPMDFVGVLYLIINEHEEVENSTWPSKVMEFLGDLPRFPKWCFDPIPQSGNEMIPEWWYVHASENDHVTTDIVSRRCAGRY